MNDELTKTQDELAKLQAGIANKETELKHLKRQRAKLNAELRKAKTEKAKTESIHTNILYIVMHPLNESDYLLIEKIVYALKSLREMYSVYFHFTATCCVEAD